MNKLLFVYRRDFNEPITLIANNHKDLEDYLESKYDFYKISVKNDCVEIVARPGYDTDIATLEWVKHI